MNALPSVAVVLAVDLPAVTVMTHVPLRSMRDPIDLEKAVEAALLHKEKVVSECLQRVEDEVDSFLEHFYGFDHKAIPFDYLDQPPASLNVVEDNLGILMHCLAEMFSPASAIRSNMAVLRRALYSDLLHPLKRTLEELSEEINESFPTTVAAETTFSSGQVMRHQPHAPHQPLHQARIRSPATAVQPPLSSSSSSLLSRISAEIRHLARMEDLEDSFLDEKFKSCGLSDVVPISGLFASRIHRLENEARTVISHWRRK